jgi:hypothetical protein
MIEESSEGVVEAGRESAAVIGGVRGGEERLNGMLNDVERAVLIVGSSEEKVKACG